MRLAVSHAAPKPNKAKNKRNAKRKKWCALLIIMILKSVEIEIVDHFRTNKIWHTCIMAMQFSIVYSNESARLLHSLIATLVSFFIHFGRVVLYHAKKVHYLHKYTHIPYCDRRQELNKLNGIGRRQRSAICVQPKSKAERFSISCCCWCNCSKSSSCCK